MKKDKKKAKSEETQSEATYTLDEVDEMTLKQFREGRLNGMYKCHDVFSDSLVRLRQSLEDVWAIEHTGPITPEKQARVETLAFAINTLITLDDMFQGEYDEKLGKLNKEFADDEVFTNEEFLQHLKDLEDE